MPLLLRIGSFCPPWWQGLLPGGLAVEQWASRPGAPGVPFDASAHASPLLPGRQRPVLRVGKGRAHVGAAGQPPDELGTAAGSHQHAVPASARQQAPTAGAGAAPHPTKKGCEFTGLRKPRVIIHLSPMVFMTHQAISGQWLLPPLWGHFQSHYRA